MNIYLFTICNFCVLKRIGKFSHECSEYTNAIGKTQRNSPVRRPEGYDNMDTSGKPEK